MVKVNVGFGADGEEQAFLVYKEFICYYSPFFDAAFNGSFEEGKTQSIDIDDVRPAVFGLFVNWLYTQKVTHDEDNATMRNLVDLWILGDRYLVPRLQNQTLVALDQRRVKSREMIGIYNRLYEETFEGSPLRRYVAQMTALAGVRSRHRDIRYFYDHLPKELLFDMFDFLRKSVTGVGRIRFSEEELKQFFVDEGETEQENRGVLAKPRIRTAKSGLP